MGEFVYYVQLALSDTLMNGWRQEGMIMNNLVVEYPIMDGSKLEMCDSQDLYMGYLS